MKKREVILLTVILVLDQITKYWIQANFTLYQAVEIIPSFFKIIYVQNTGGAWGIFSGSMALFYIATLVGISFLGYLFYTSKKKNTWYRISLVMMIAGTLGNFYDRLIFGYVRDFLDFYPFGYDFPVFNVADIALTVGVALFALVILTSKEEVA